MERNEMNRNDSFGKGMVNESFGRNSGNRTPVSAEKTFSGAKGNGSRGRKNKVPPVAAHVKMLDKAYSEKMPERPTICIHSIGEETG